MAVIEVYLELVDIAVFAGRRNAEQLASATLLEFDEGGRVAALCEGDCLGIVEIDVVTVALDVLVWGYTESYFSEDCCYYLVD
jgi:hypothetical protein